MTSCNQGNESSAAQEIIDKTIKNAGGEKYENATINFTFRDTEYSSSRENGVFKLTRTFMDSLGKTKDVLGNSGFQRFRNEQEIDLPDTSETKFANSVNSVHYFVQLPYGLNTPAVQKELVGEAEIEGENYHEIKVTFKQEGGGVDHEDIYMYWINKENSTIDYLAYKFFVEEGGIRFREAYNPRIIEGLRFVDYRNYKIEPWKAVDLKELDSLFEAGKLEFVSDIKTEDVSVEI